MKLSKIVGCLVQCLLHGLTILASTTEQSNDDLIIYMSEEEANGPPISFFSFSEEKLSYFHVNFSNSDIKDLNVTTNSISSLDKLENFYEIFCMAFFLSELSYNEVFLKKYNEIKDIIVKQLIGSKSNAWKKIYTKYYEDVSLFANNFSSSMKTQMLSHIDDLKEENSIFKVYKDKNGVKVCLNRRKAVRFKIRPAEDVEDYPFSEDIEKLFLECENEIINSLNNSEKIKYEGKKPSEKGIETLAKITMRPLRFYIYFVHKQMT